MQKIGELLFGTAGIPLSAHPRDTENGIRKVKALELGAMELEFVRSVNITKESAPRINNAGKSSGIILTCHAPYYINLNAVESEKRSASRSRILKSAEILDACGGWSVCFHPGYYLNDDKNKVYDAVKEQLKGIMNDVKDRGYNVWIRPETTGKATQFGDVEELLKLSQELEQVMPVIDFSHLHARTNGRYNTKKEFDEVLELTEKHLGKEGLNNMHIHLSGIEYGEKGEKNHLILEESDMNYKELLKVWKEFDIRGCVISESPNI